MDKKKCPSCGSLVRVTIRHIENYKLVREYCHHCCDKYYATKAGVLPVLEIQHKRAEEPQDTVLAWMKQNDVPLTVENYLDIEYCGNPPDLEGELLASLPRCLTNLPLRDMDKWKCFECGDDILQEVGLCCDCEKEIGEAEDVAWMAEMGVGWVPDSDDDNED